MKTINADIEINGEPARIKGNAPFALLPADGKTDQAGWVFSDATGINCVTYADGMPATFSTESVAALMAQDLNEQAGL